MRQRFWSRRPGGVTAPALGLALVVALVAGGGHPARAERVHDLSRALVHAKREKTRIAAAASLGQLRDPRAREPLIRALRGDSSHVVRGMAATALGSLGDPAALPALERARRDRSRAVRLRVLVALSRIRDRQTAPAHVEAVDAPGRGAAAAAAAPAPPRRAGGPAGYSFAARAAPAAAPDKVYVILKSASDKSAGSADRAVREKRATRMRSLMARQLQQSQDVTLLASMARAPSVEPYFVDLTVVKLDHVERGPNVEVECEIRAAISTREGKMLSFLTGGAKVQVPRTTFRAEFLPQLHGEALEGAVRSVHRDLVAHLIKLSPPVAPREQVQVELQAPASGVQQDRGEQREDQEQVGSDHGGRQTHEASGRR